MLTIPKGRTPGHWWPTQDASGKVSGTIYCPKCEGAMSLRNHTISAAGEVTPSVVCPTRNVECPHCGFHEVVKLAEWPETLADLTGERMKTLEGLLREGVDGFGRVLVSTSDDAGVRDWQKRARAALDG